MRFETTLADGKTLCETKSAELYWITDLLRKGPLWPSSFPGPSLPLSRDK